MPEDGIQGHVAMLIHVQAIALISVYDTHARRCRELLARLEAGNG